MDCKEGCSSKVISLGRSGNACGPCGSKSSIPVGRIWWKLVVRSKEANTREMKKFSDILVGKYGRKDKYEDAEVKAAMDEIFLDQSNSLEGVETIDFVDYKPIPMNTNGEFVYYKGGIRTVLRNFGSVEQIQVAVCKDPDCKDPECQKFQAEMKEKAAREGFRLV